MVDEHGAASSFFDVADRMAEAAAAWINRLSPAQRNLGVYPSPADDAQSERERVTWFYTPTDHGGLAIGRQRPVQQQLAMKLLATGLTMEGYVAATTIIGLENVLDRVEGFGVQWDRERGRDTGLYYVRVFGDPGPTGAWGWRFAGHHVSVNFLIVDRRVVSSSPLFFGADPAASPLPGGARLRPLGGIEDLARRFAGTLKGWQRDRMQLLDRPVSDIVTGNRASLSDGDEMMHMQDLWRGKFEDAELARLVDSIDERAEATSGFTAADHTLMAYRKKPAGLSGEELNRTQRELLHTLRSAVTSSTVSLADVSEGSGDDLLAELHIAWGGPLDGEGPCYFRLQAPRLLFEYDNTQRDGNHVHSVLRDPNNDFGIDILRAHRRAIAH